MRGVILAGGPGMALRPITDEVPKPMIPILGKPLIQYAIERLSSNGIRDIIVVTDASGERISSYFGDGNVLGVNIQYVQQPQQESGIDGAISALMSTIREEERFILVHCDIIASNNLLTRTLNAAHNTGSEMAIAVALQSEVQDFGVVKLDAEGLVEEVIPLGKPKEGNYVVAGTFLLTGKIFKYLDDGIPFNQCFNHFIRDGGEVAGGIWNETWIDVGRPWDILRACSFLLDQIKTTEISVKAKIETNVEIKGPVIIEDGVEILNGTVIKGPAFIGKNAFIGNNTLIRENSSIGERAKIGMGVEIRSSVIMKKASIARLSYVGASIVGPAATLHSGAMTIITRTPSAPITIKIQGKPEVVPFKKFGAIIGPHSHISEHSSLLPGTVIDSY
ncbi:MAG: sugar phosphate nucleotidyltransferase, partial [Candidatus Kariarchaeaceae archaeon]